MDSSAKFDTRRAAEYVEQSKIALAGYEACHELTACLLAALVGEWTAAKILVVGAGGPGLEVITAAHLGKKWTFLALDPSTPMLEIARENIEKAGFSDRTTFHLGYVRELEMAEEYDGAIMFGVLHHIPDDEGKKELLDSIRRVLKRNAPFFVSGNRYHYHEKPLFLKAWESRWRLHGVAKEIAESKLATILSGANPPSSDEDMQAILERSGFEVFAKYFSSLFWASWVTFKS